MVGPNHCTPVVEIPQSWRHLHEDEMYVQGEDLSAWWLAFNDPVLNQLVEEASRQNLGLRQAGLRIVEARAQRGAVRGELFPAFDYDAGYTFQRFSTNGSNFSLFGGGRGFSIDTSTDQWSTGINANWEIDVFWAFEARCSGSGRRHLYQHLELPRRAGHSAFGRCHKLHRCSQLSTTTANRQEQPGDPGKESWFDAEAV